MIAPAVLLAQTPQGELDVNLTLPGILALVIGVLILIRPRLLSYLVAFYLIAVGLILIFDVTI
ncbi:MAG TPA: DUF3096 domain-containing protein [Mycobacteriales bacterium]|nr:DUF3096 domain-containing protein [Mycobacteriales bacterium]